MLGGHHRLIWPAEYLADDGVDVRVVKPADRQLSLVIKDDRVSGVEIDFDADVIVLQRVTHGLIAQAIPFIRAKGIAVVMDVDDDLSSIHPDNPAYESIHPKKYGSFVNGRKHLHSWKVLQQACRDATMVTVSTPALLEHYAAHGRGSVLDNYLADHYYEQRHDDSDLIGWAASLHSHPNDPAVVGPSVARMMRAGHRFRVFGEPDGVAKTFGLDEDPECTSAVPLMDWPKQIAELGIGIAPLADTRFNASKSRLKPLELSACGVPWVGSPRAEYRKLHDLGCGILADRPRDWFKALKMLASSTERRAEESEKCRAVADTQRLRSHAWRWAEAWEHALRIQRADATP